MSLLARYRQWYEHEKDSNHKMLTMLESVPESRRSDPRFQQAVTLADHLAACRENWLNHMDNEGLPFAAWWNAEAEFTTLRPRFAALEARWTDYLAGMDDAKLAQDFAFTDNGETFHVPTEVQIVQLFGHAAYHRGQIVLLVDQLGGETVDTDYVDWWWAQQGLP